MFRQFTRLARAAARNPATIATRYQSTLVSNKINLQSIVGKYSQGPLTIRYTSDHEWLACHPDGTAFLGITKYAADALGDATYVDLPEVGDFVEEGSAIGAVESVKSASEIYIPVNAEVIAVNSELEGNPKLINSDPLGEGWFVQVKLANVEELENASLMSESDYEKSIVE